jgi:hypothetical protein
MRFGFFLGFLIGAAIASLISLSQQEEPGPEAAGPLDQLKRQAREAREAARLAAAEKEAEMLRDWEKTRHQD